MQTKQLPLSTARWIVLALYFTGLVVYPVVGGLVKLPRPAPPEALRILPLVFLIAGVVDYMVSLVIEAVMLAKARKAQSSIGAGNVAVVSAGFGEILAIWGLVLTLLGAGSWGALLYGLCFVHGVHLMLRWSNFAEVAAGEET